MDDVHVERSPDTPIGPVISVDPVRSVAAVSPPQSSMSELLAMAKRFDDRIARMKTNFRASLTEMASAHASTPSVSAPAGGPVPAVIAPLPPPRPSTCLPGSGCQTPELVQFLISFR